MNPDDLESKVKAAQNAVKDVDKDLRKTAFEIVLKRLLEGGTPETVRMQEKIPKDRKPKGSSSVSTAPIALDLKGGKTAPPLRDFYKNKSPRTNQEKVTVFVYYINKYLGISEASTGHIVSCYNEVNEKKPLKILQLFRDIKHLKGWLDNGEASNAVKISIAGENLVEHDLPRPNK